MPSLAQLLGEHRRILLLDASSTRVTTGLLEAGRPGEWRDDADEAGRALFEQSQQLLSDGDLSLDAIDAFVFCEGPGSLLGTRTVSMALRTWTALRPRPVYSYQSLAVAALAEWQREPRAFSVIADARRDRWHVQSVDANGGLAPLRRVEAAALPDGELKTPAGFRAWAPLPARVTTCAYLVDALSGDLSKHDLLLPAAAPDALQFEAPDYKKWTALPHSADTAARR